MRVIIAAVGRLKDGPERDLLQRYRTRFEAAGKRLGFAPVSWVEVSESRAGTASQRCVEEGAGLLKLARAADFIIALDERGRMLSSGEFAKALARVRDDGAQATAILIGGPDGVSPDVLRAARLTLSLGAMTLPHALARVLLAEQLYRAVTILAGHPYHRV